MRISKTRTYHSWRGMKERCSNPNHKDYHLYGGKGIKVCKEWVNSYSTFLTDMGERPDEKTLDRIDSDKDYNKSNCRWADQLTQCRNQNIRKDNKSGCKGVSKKKTDKKWCVRISTKEKRIHIGYFENLDDAIKARKDAEVKYWG
jgi:hypothetical protein